MSAKNRDAWLELLFELEGGFSNHPQDNGGATRHGVTQATLASWRGKPVTVEDVQALTKEEARDIALARYWNAVKADDLPGGLDIYVADFAYNSGPARAVKELQPVLGVEADGYVGPKTLAACRSEPDTARLIKAVHDARMAFLRELADWKHFGTGWENRCRTVLAMSLPLVTPNLVEAKAPKAALQVGVIASIAVAVSQALPAIVDQMQRAHDGAAGGDWAAVASAVGVAVAALLGGWTRYRAHQAGKPA